eukprot:10253082-Heterocapsa_arctica.AAC.1
MPVLFKMPVIPCTFSVVSATVLPAVAIARHQPGVVRPCDVIALVRIVTGVAARDARDAANCRP